MNEKKTPGLGQEEAEQNPGSSPAPGPSPEAPGETQDPPTALSAEDDDPSQRMVADLAFYLPGGSIALRQAKETLATGKRPAKARLVSLLLTYAPWEEIWKLMDEDQIRKLFPHLDLPPGIHRAWARVLGLD